MSIGSLSGIIASAAGSPATQAGADVDRAKQDATGQARQIATNLQADSAAGIAETDGKDIEANDRDADGRRLWEKLSKHTPATDEPSNQVLPHSKDASGNSGNSLDLLG